MWTTFAYYFRNHGVVVMPSRTVGSKLHYVCHYKAEIGGDEFRACRACLWALGDPIAYYNFGSQKPYECACTIC